MVIVFRYFVAFPLMLLAVMDVMAADFGVNPCVVEKITGGFDITADPVLADIGDVVGAYTVNVTVSSCANLGGVRVLKFMLASQPQDPLVNLYSRCKTTVSGLGLDTTGLQYNRCSSTQLASDPQGPYIGQVSSLGPFPATTTQTFPIRKSGPILPGAASLNLVNPNISVVGGPDNNTGNLFQGSGIEAGPPGEVVGSECSLATADVMVSFGDISDVGAKEDFEISFDGCTDQIDATGFNNAVSLEFSSQRIRSDGSALQNCIANNCAKGVQIELQDANSAPINLLTPYKLSANTPVFGPNGMTYTFGAEIKPNPDEMLEGGKIDTQLVFETIVE